MRFNNKGSYYFIDMRRALLAFTALLLLSCGSSDTTANLNLREVRLPNGDKVRAEVMINPEDMARGMMYRDALPRDRGMLFIHAKPGNYPYWMHNCKIPLDMIWLDESRRIVEIYNNAEPCPGEASTCPSYGGRQLARYVLELAGGEARRRNLQRGDTLSF